MCMAVQRCFPESSGSRDVGTIQPALRKEKRVPSSKQKGGINSGVLVKRGFSCLSNTTTVEKILADGTLLSSTFVTFRLNLPYLSNDASLCPALEKINQSTTSSLCNDIDNQSQYL